MTVYQPYQVLIVSVGGGRPMEFVFRMSNGRTLRDLTGQNGWVSFAYEGADPHIVRQARVSGGSVFYDEIFGDEYPTAGADVLAWASVQHVDYGTALGRGFFVTSSEVIRRSVVA